MLEPCVKPSSIRRFELGEGVERYSNGPTSGLKLLRGFSAYILCALFSDNQEQKHDQKACDAIIEYIS